MAYHAFRMAVFPLWFFWLAVCCEGVGSEPDGSAVEHKPPLLKPLRWQALQKCYRDVFVDDSGRAWLYRSSWRNSFNRPRTDYLVCPELPDKVIEMPSANVPLGFDGANRFWEVGQYGLCCTDVHRDTFLQRRPVEPDKEPPDAAQPNRKDLLPFAQIMFEHSSGRLYFFDAEGVHVLDGDAWSYHKFSPPLRYVQRYTQSPTSGVRIIEGPRGEVYVWSAGHAPQDGLHVHDGSAWKSYPAPPPGEISLQADGTIHIQVVPGYEVRLTLPDGTLQSAAVLTKHDPRRDARNARFRQREVDTESLADFTGEELAAYGKFLGQDAQGRVYFVAMSPGNGASDSGQVAVFDPRYKDDAPTLKYECFRLDNGFHTARLDGDGRLWARLSVKDQPFLSRYDGGWTHFADPTGWTPDRYPDRVLVKRYGQVWAMLPRNEVIGLVSANYAGGVEAAERFVPGMANPSFLQPLRNGGMIAAGSGRAYLFDGREWKVYDSLRELVEANYAWLRKQIDNTVEARGYFCDPPGCDATGHVWVAEYNFRGAYDGKRWSEIPKGAFRMNAAGDRVAANGMLYDASVWPSKGLTALPGRGGGPVWFDRQGGVWARDESSTSTYRYESNRFVRFNTFLSASRRPLSEDSAGRFWFSDGGWSLLLPNGQTSETLPREFPMNAPIVEQGRGVFWAFASDGLLRLRVEEPKGRKPKIVVDKHFPRLIPQDEIKFLGLDRRNNLWLATQYGKSGLYRIELPPLEDGKP